MVMRIQMRSQSALIGMETQKAKLEIEQPPADYELDIEHVKVLIDSELPKVTINQNQAFSESGLQGVLELTFSNAQIAKQLLMQGIERASQQGDEIADISKPNPIPDHAKYNAYDQFKRDYNVTTMPMSGPDIEVIEGTVDIEVQEGKAELTTKPNKPLIDYTPGRVSTFMQRYNSLEIWTVGSQFDKTI